jgi:hypothetical protein
MKWMVIVEGKNSWRGRNFERKENLLARKNPFGKAGRNVTGKDNECVCGGIAQGLGYLTSFEFGDEDIGSNVVCGNPLYISAMEEGIQDPPKNVTDMEGADCGGSRSSSRVLGSGDPSPEMVSWPMAASKAWDGPAPEPAEAIF